MHAGVTIATGDAGGRERLCRYGARPALSLARLTALPDGRLAYRTKYPGPHGHTHRVMTPVEFLARLAALVPPPRYPLVRYHGVLAPNAPWRREIVPRAPPAPACEHAPGSDAVERAARAAARRADATTPGRAPRAAAPRRGTQRAAGGTRVPRAELLARVYGVDVAHCPRCTRPLAVVATITAPATIARILSHLGEAASPRDVPSRAWDPIVVVEDAPW